MLPAPKKLNPAIADFFEQQRSNPNAINWDYLLYDAAQLSLNRTIDRIGQNVVEQRVKLLQTLQAAAEEACQAKAIFPCSHEGVPQHEQSEKDCFFQDSGCGHRCVDKVLRRLPYRETWNNSPR